MDGRILASGSDVSGPANHVIDLPDCLLVPGLVDLHAHPGTGLSRYGVDADDVFLSRGTTTLLSQGDAGADNWLRFREEVARPARVRIRLALNLSRRGEQGAPCFDDLDDADVPAAVSAIRDAGDLVWGVAVNVNAVLTGRNDPREIVRRARLVSDETGVPILFGSRHATDWPLAEQLAMLRPGDVVTYCFHGEVDRIVSGRHVLPAVREARERGIRFDVGHGMSSFDFEVAGVAVGDGFLPDTISTDGYARHEGLHPRHDLPRTLSKLLACGMSEGEAFRAVTAVPAAVLGLSRETGTLAPGACADLCALRWREDVAPLVDTAGHTRPGGCWDPVLTVRAGVPVV